MKKIPLQAVPAQSFTVPLAGQYAQITVYQKSTGLFVDLSISSDVIVTGVICRHSVKIVRDEYLGFIGDLVFFDTQGESDPEYSGLGSRYQLFYLEASDLEQ